MLDKMKHQLTMSKILLDIYQDIHLSNCLGFKGGTAAYFFYNLPRFSVDLDFDLITTDETETQNMVADILEKIIGKYGIIKDKKIKRWTIFYLISYESAEHTIKIEVNTRNFYPNINTKYEIDDYLGIAMLRAKKSYMLGSKLMALTDRKVTANRDIFDINFFLKNNWDIDQEVIEIRSNGLSVTQQIDKCITVIEKVNKNAILQGLGELVDDKQKIWIKNNLQQETIFLLKSYQRALKQTL